MLSQWTLSRRQFGVGASLSTLVALLAGHRPATAANASFAGPVPAGTELVAADQNERLQTLMIASGQQKRLEASVSYANFLGGPAILEAFRAGALDLAMVGNTPPIQAHAAGERILIVAAQRSSGPDYRFAVRPGLAIARLADLAGKRIAYAEGTGRQPFVLAALRQTGLSRSDVELVPLRVSDFPDAVRSGQVDVAPLNEPHYSRYRRDYADQRPSTLPVADETRLQRNLSYLYASGEALNDPAKTAAIAQFVAGWIAAYRWSTSEREAWVDAYYVRRQNLTAADGLAAEEMEGEISFPLLRTLIETQQATIDLIFDAGDLPERLDARDEFDLRFDDVIAASA